MTPRGRSQPKRALRWLVRSLATRLVILVVVFATVPILVYQQFRSADQERQQLLLQAAQARGELVATGLSPLLEAINPQDLPGLNAELARYSDAETRVRLLLRPESGSAGQRGFFYVAAAPMVPNAYLDRERSELLEQGVFARLVETCSGNQPLAVRVQREGGDQELLTSITPVNTAFGCWAIVTSHTTDTYLGTALGQPYWQTPEVRVAALIYLVMAGLVLAIFVGIWGNLHRFGQLARRMGYDESQPVGAFSRQNTIPELDSVAGDFDRLVEILRNSAQAIRRAAEDNSHAFKTPLAVIRQSLEPLKRAINAQDKRAHRALDMIEHSVERLDTLVSYAQRLDEATADLLEPPRRQVDLSDVMHRLLETYRDILMHRHISLDARLGRSVTVRASEELIETVAENIIDNAISFSPPGGALDISIRPSKDSVELVIEDDGPGVEADQMDKIFERYFSSRPKGHSHMGASGPDGSADNGDDEAAGGQHYGIGLWIVRQNLEAIGGRVLAENSDAGGLRVRAVFPTRA